MNFIQCTWCVSLNPKQEKGNVILANVVSAQGPNVEFLVGKLQLITNQDITKCSGKLMRRDEQKTQLIVVLLIVLNFMFFRKKIQSNVNYTKLFMEFSTRKFSLTLFSKKTIRHLDLK